VIAGRETIRAGIEDLARDLGREAKAASGILDVDHGKVNLVTAAERGQQVAHGLPAGLADHVSDEE
jgi:hypothetical protein